MEFSIITPESLQKQFKREQKLALLKAGKIAADTKVRKQTIFENYFLLSNYPFKFS